MSVIDDKFKELENKNEIAFMPYLTAGFPTMDEFLENLKVLSESGADIIEVGLPFSDPIADGPTIQYSSHIALSNGANIRDIIESVRELEVNIPLVFMTYLNPVLAYGQKEFFKDIKDAGVSGVIIPDAPVEESGEVISLGESYDIDTIFLVTPASRAERISLVAKKSRGFIYCVSVTGITGVRDKLASGLSDFIEEVRSNTNKPLAVGFGISSPEHIENLKEEVDGVIVGSRIIEAIRNDEDLGELITKLKSATKLA